MLNRKKNKNNICKINTLLGQETAITGNIIGGGNYKIDGMLIGDIDVTGDVIIVEGATVTGKITAQNVIISGTVNGGIIAHGQLSVKSTAQVCGKHQCKGLVAEEGAVFKSFCFITGEDDMRDTDALVDSVIDDIAM
jgi:cytoskeletal protein CcmA (bactofilin family)